jgi:cytochrome c-type biogenesis protein CcmH/NrfG
MTELNRRERLAAMLAEDPNDPELRYMLGMEHASASDDAAAVACFEELLRRTSNYAPAYHQAARALQRLDRIADARGMLERGIPVALAMGDTHAAGEMQQLLDFLTLG